MIRLYGSPRTRVNRVMWLLEEMGIEYELRDAFANPGDPPSEEVKRLNPNAKVPILVSGDFVMWESLAINLHLVERHGGDLAPKTEAGRALALQWTLWAATELEPRIFEVTRYRLPQVDSVPDEARSREAESELLPTLRVLDGALSESGHLLEGRFTVADVNVASVVAPGIPARVDFAPVPNVEAWINACIRRPAARSVFARAMKSAGLA
jgi:glutathione S-transferase